MDGQSKVDEKAAAIAVTRKNDEAPIMVDVLGFNWKIVESLKAGSKRAGVGD